MKIIFETETELVPTAAKGTASPGRRAPAGKAVVFAHSRAAVDLKKGLLKIEQRCFLRRGKKAGEQLCNYPQMILEPVSESTGRMVKLATRLHQRFVERSRRRLPSRAMV